jgi:putative transposase
MKCGEQTLTQTITIREGRANVFVAVEHANSEVVGIHASRSANRFEALEPVRQGVHRCFGAIAPGVARGLKLRHDHGSNYMSGDFQDEIECLGIEASPSFVREPEGNGVAERFITGFLGHVRMRFVHLDPPGLIKSWKI